MTGIETILARFSEWMEAANAHPHIKEPTAMCLSTVAANGVPSSRMVLLKKWDAQGFTFYTNMESRKSSELKQNARAALCLYWMPLGRQVRIEGNAQAVDDADADAYFAERQRESRLGAWASEQSAPLPDRATLERRYDEAAAEYQGRDVPRPPFWAGWRVEPQRIEFWQEGAHRLHERECFVRQPNGEWKKELLYP